MTMQIKMKTTRTEKFTLIADSRNYSMNEIRNIWTNTEKSLPWGVLRILKSVHTLDTLDTKRSKSRWHRVTERVCVSMLSHFSHVWLFATLWIIAPQAPLSMGSPGKNTGVGCHFLLQGIFPTQGSNLGLLHCRQILNHLNYLRTPQLYIHVDWRVK